MKKGILKDFAKSTGKHLCESLFFNKVAGVQLGCTFDEKDYIALFIRTNS